MREKENSKNDIKEEKKQNVLRRSEQLLDGNEREGRFLRQATFMAKLCDGHMPKWMLCGLWWNL